MVPHDFANRFYKGSVCKDLIGRSGSRIPSVCVLSHQRTIGFQYILYYMEPKISIKVGLLINGVSPT